MSDCEEGGVYPSSNYSSARSDISGVTTLYYNDGDIEEVKFTSSSYSGSGSLDEGSYDEDRPQSVRLTQ